MIPMWSQSSFPGWRVGFRSPVVLGLQAFRMSPHNRLHLELATATLYLYSLVHAEEIMGALGRPGSTGIRVGLLTLMSPLGRGRALHQHRCRVLHLLCPQEAQTGFTRLRVIQQENSTLPLDPCASFTWGSVMDFGVQVTGGVDCSGYSGDDQADAIVAPSLPYIDSNSTTICYSSQSAIYNSPDVFYQFTTGANAANVEVSLCQSSFDTYLSVLDASGNNLAFNDDDLGCSGGTSRIYMPVTPNTTYYAVVEGWNVLSGDYVIEISEDNGVGFPGVDQMAVKVYPNPGDGHVRVEASSVVERIEVVDLFGRIVVGETALQQSKFDLDLSHLEAGQYIIKCVDGIGGEQYHNIVIN